MDKQGDYIESWLRILYPQHIFFIQLTIIHYSSFVLNSTLGMDIWIGMAESAWICPECETTATHKQGKGKKSTLMGGQEK